MDDMTVKSVRVGAGDPVGGSGAAAAGAPTGASFAGSLKDAIAQVNEAQLEAGRTVDKFVVGESQNVHQMMIALQKADVSFQLMMQVRNKLVSAYEEIQRMQV